MTLSALDELRHEANDDLSFRESLYFNFYEPKEGIAAWIYIWLTPNKRNKAGMLVSFYRGRWLDKTLCDAAMRSPGHRIQRGNDWIYFYTCESASPVANDFDDMTMGGLRLRRIEPLRRYELTYDDGQGTSFAFDGEFMTLPYDYADGVHKTPPALATNRYHRPWRVRGWLQINAGRIPLNCTGDTDHSWGKRDWGSLFADDLYSFKYWAFQSNDDKVAISVIREGRLGAEAVLGFVAIKGIAASAASVEVCEAHDIEGVQKHVNLGVVDTLGRTVKASLEAVESCVALGEASFWCFEGFGRYSVDGFGTAPGLVSYAWPTAVSVQQLYSGDLRRPETRLRPEAK